MRQSKNGNWVIEEGIFCGVSTGFDYCAEHESGIVPLQSAAGIVKLLDVNQKTSWFGFKKHPIDFGLERTTIKNISKVIHGYAEMEDGSEYYIFGYNTGGKIPMSIFKEDFEAYWDDRAFVIASKDKDKINELAKAAYTNDLAFTTGGKVLEDHAGIRLVIKSKTPQHIIDTCALDDSMNHELRILDKKINIQQKLKKAGCDFFACSPMWKDYDKKEIHWWLNPRHQKTYDYGAFTYDELIQWTKGEGPIILVKEDNTEDDIEII